MSTRISAMREHEMADSNGNGASTPEVADRSERASRATVDEQAQEPAPKRKRGRLSKKKLIVGGIVGGTLLIGALLYWVHVRDFQSTDDAYTTTHLHDISARVAGYARR